MSQVTFARNDQERVNCARAGLAELLPIASTDDFGPDRMTRAALLQLNDRRQIRPEPKMRSLWASWRRGVRATWPRGRHQLEGVLVGELSGRDPLSIGRPASSMLIACTVEALTPNRSAITRAPSVRPGAFRASWIRSFSCGAIGGRPRRLPSLRAL